MEFCIVSIIGLHKVSGKIGVVIKMTHGRQILPEQKGDVALVACRAIPKVKVGQLVQVTSCPLSGKPVCDKFSGILIHEMIEESV